MSEIGETSSYEKVNGDCDDGTGEVNLLSKVEGEIWFPTGGTGKGSV